MAVMKKQVAKFVLLYVMAPLARLVYQKYRPVIVGITGSVGKTITTTAVYEVLKPYFDVKRSVGSANSEWSIVASLLNPGYQPHSYNKKRARGIMGPQHALWCWIVGISRFFLPLKYPRILVLELGIDAPGDMEFFNGLMKYDVAIVTRVGQAHLEFFEDYNQLLKEKTLIFNGLKETGLAIVGADQADLVAASDKLVVRHESVGSTSGATVSIVGAKINNDRFNVSYKFDDQSVVINLPFGSHFQIAAAFAIAVGREFALTPEQMETALGNLQPVYGRLNLVKLSGGVSLIDDSYNANLDSVKLAFEAMETVPARHKIAVLGDMKELGSVSVESHKEVGRMAAKQVDYLFTVGELGKLIAEGAIQAGMRAEMVHAVGDLDTLSEVESLSSAILEKIGDNDAVLIKASRAMALERVARNIISKLS